MCVYVCVCVCVYVCVLQRKLRDKSKPSLNYLFLHGTISKEIGNKSMSDPYVPSRYLCVFGVREDWGLRLRRARGKKASLFFLRTFP